MQADPEPDVLLEAAGVQGYCLPGHERPMASHWGGGLRVLDASKTPAIGLVLRSVSFQMETLKSIKGGSSDPS